MSLRPNPKAKTESEASNHMGHYIGPVEKLERREGVSLDLNHGHVQVDGRRLDIPSAIVLDGQRVQIKPGSPVAPLSEGWTENVGRVPAWLEVDHEALAGRVLRAPQRDEVQMPVAEQLVIERYARR